MLPEEAVYCPNCGFPVKRVVGPALASWGERFAAWLIDIIVLGILMAPIYAVLRWLLAWSFWPWSLMPHSMRWASFIDLGPSSFVYFLYWTFMEGLYGQSIGKMVLKIKVTRVNGGDVDLPHAAIESLGKAFLLPIDCVLGWILYSDRKQRLFNYVSDTVVVKATG